MPLKFLRRILQAAKDRPKKPLPAAKEGDFGTPNNPRDKGEEREETGPEVAADFLERNGVLFTQSSWVEYARYWPDRGELEIGFQDGWVAYYGGCDLAEARSFLVAPSKGKWIHANIKAGYMPDGRHWIHAKRYRHK